MNQLPGIPDGTPIRGPERAPCKSCPYRCDVPSGVWAPEEYDKLPAYDRDTMYQPTALFQCHQATGAICAGWAAVHDGARMLSVRLGLAFGTLTEQVADAIIDYESPVPVFASGAEAAAHGRAEIDNPGDAARSTIDRVTATRNRTRRPRR